VNFFGPTRAGPFLLERRLGRGGAGTVWQGRHELVGARVAIKLVPEETRDPELLDLETATLASLDHPHIVQILDEGHLEEPTLDHPEGTRWLAMELASGSSFERRMELSWDDMVLLIRHILAGLAHAHARGVLHRDVKPGNLLCFEGPELRWKLADFGIAQIQNDPTRHLGGSPSYSPPEQAASRADQGPWTDLYAFGMTVWNLLTHDKVPWRIVKGVLRHDVPPFAPRVDVPQGLEDWLRRLLEQDPAQRPARAADALQGFEDLLVGQQTVGLLLPVDAPIQRSPPPGLLHGVGLQLFGQRTVGLVGRTEARRSLWSALLEAARGMLRAVHLSGPPGSGRSRLARWLARTAHAQGAHAVVLDPQRPDRIVREVLGSKAPSVVRGFAARHELHPVVRQSLLAVAGGAVADVPSLVELLAVASAERPLVLVHDARADWTDELVDRVAERLADRAILVVRADGGRRDEDEASVVLGPMGRVEMEDLLDHTLPLEATLRSFLREHAHGVPGRPLAWLRRWAASDGLQLTSHGISRVGGLPDSAPPLAADLQEQRVADLFAAIPDAEHELVALLAVLGPEVQRAWLEPLGLTHGPVLHEMVLRGHLAPSRRTWRFTDPSFHDALLAALPEPAAAHRWAAELLRDGPEYLRGLHLRHAGEHDEAFWLLVHGADRLRLAGEPRLDLLEAARRSLEQGDWPEAHRRWIVLGRSEGMALGQLGHASQAVEPLSHSVRLARRGDRPVELALSLDALAKTRAMTGDHADLEPLFQEAADLVATDPRLLARIQSSWAEYQVFRGDHEHVLRHLPAHLAHMGENEEMNARVALARACAHVGDVDEAIRHALHAKALAETLHARGGARNACSVLGEIYLLKGRNASAHATFEEALALARHTTSTNLAIAHINLAFSHCRLERFAEGLEACNEGWTLARRLGWRALELVGRATALWPLAALGQGEAFDEQLLACQPLTQERFSSWEVGEAIVRSHRLLPDDHSPRKRRMQRLALGVASTLPEGALRSELLHLAGDSRE